MNPWTVLQLSTAAIAIISLIGGEKLSLPILTAAGIAILGVTAILVGLEGIIRRRIVLGSRYHSYGTEPISDWLPPPKGYCSCFWEHSL